MESKTQSIHCGNADDGFDTLKRLCEAKANELCSTLELSSDETKEIPFWTSDFPELICVGKFSKSDAGNVIYELDYTESTL
jgi:hypothetical protein